MTLGTLLWVGVMAAMGSTAQGADSSSPPSGSPAAGITTLGLDESPLAAGIYRIQLDQIPSGGAGLPAVLITVPDGWSNLRGWGVYRGALVDAPVSVQFWDVGSVYGHPCQWQGTLFDPGPGVDDLANALVLRPMRGATEPTDVTLDGHDGRYVELSVPADLDFATCDADGAEHYFESWVGVSDGDRYHQGPGQVDRLWILDVDGRRLVIDGFDMPFATDAERQELLDVIASIRFEAPTAPSPLPS